MTTLEYIYELLEKRKKPIPFFDLVEELEKKVGFNRDKVGTLYSDLMMDNRFINVEQNSWDLSSRYSYNQRQNNVELIEDESEEDDDENEVVGKMSDNDEDEDSYDDEDLSDVQQSIKDVDLSDDEEII